MQSRSPQKKSTIIPCVVVTSIQCCSRRKGRDEYQSGGSKQGQGTEGEGGATGVGREGPHRAESWKGKRSFSLVSATFLYTGLSACRLACTRRREAPPSPDHSQPHFHFSLRATLRLGPNRRRPPLRRPQTLVRCCLLSL